MVEKIHTKPCLQCPICKVSNCLLSHIRPSRCIICTVRRTWSSAGFQGVSCFVVWSRGLFTLWLLKPVLQQAARSALLSTSPLQLPHRLPSCPLGLFLSALIRCRSPGILHHNPMDQLENILCLEGVWRRGESYEIMKRILMEER